MWHYYIYYRIDDAHAHTLDHLVRSMQARLACQTGVQGKLLHKRGESSLWMEIYENVDKPDIFEQALSRGVEKFELDLFLASGAQRNLECFED